MPITYTWTPTTLVGYPTFDGQTDVVTRVFYTVLADGGEGHTADYSNFEYTPLNPDVPFIPYADLTPEIVIGWVQTNLGSERVAAIEESLSIQIQRQVSPPPEPDVLPLPWPTPEPPAPEVAETPAPEVPEPPAPDLSTPTN